MPPAQGATGVPGGEETTMGQTGQTPADPAQAGPAARILNSPQHHCTQRLRASVPRPGLETEQGPARGPTGLPTNRGLCALSD